MGLLTGLRRRFGDPYDKYQMRAHEELGRVRKIVRGKYGDDRDTVRPLEAEALKFRIRCMSEQGGFEMYKHALARWQIYKALYPEWITDADRPEFTPECWKDPPHL